MDEKLVCCNYQDNNQGGLDSVPDVLKNLLRINRKTMIMSLVLHCCDFFRGCRGCQLLGCFDAHALHIDISLLRKGTLQR